MSTSIIAKCPDCNNEILYKGHAQRPRIVCSKCKKKFYIGAQNTQAKKRVLKQKSIPPQDTTQALQFIDDPDELLMSVAVRELNKPNPDPRWANVLITTRKENIGQSKKEGKIRSQFKSMDIKDIAKISSGRPIDISLKPDLEESS